MSQAQEGIHVVLSAVQFAALLTQESVDEAATATNRLWGGLRVVGGVLELLGAGVLCVAPEPTLTSKAGCVVFGVHGADTTIAGARQVWTGRDSQSLTHTGTAALAHALGTDPAMADTIGLTVDIGVPLGVAAWLGAARVAAVRAGRICLIQHEALTGGRVGGHTIAKHVGRTEQQLRARLAAEPQRDIVSDVHHAEGGRGLHFPSDAIECCKYQGMGTGCKFEATASGGRHRQSGRVRRGSPRRSSRATQEGVACPQAPDLQRYVVLRAHRLFGPVTLRTMKKKPPAYPELDQLLHVYFGEDFDIWGNTIEELVGCYKRDSPVADHQTLRDEIARFKQTHSNDLDEAFLAAYKNFFNPPLWNQTTASFLTEVDRLLSNPGSAPPPP